MKEMQGDLFQLLAPICIPTNGCLKKNGAAVMGAGVAKQAKQRFKNIDKSLGFLIDLQGNHVHLISGVPPIFSFPTKDHWRDGGDLRLVVRSAYELSELIARMMHPFKNVYLPRVGCGLGGMNWENVVKPALNGILDDTFIVVTP